MEQVRAPVGEVQMRVEILFHPGVGIAFEIAEVIFVHEARRGDFGAGGISAQFLHLHFREAAVNGLEFEVLVFAQRGKVGRRRGEFKPGRDGSAWVYWDAASTRQPGSIFTQLPPAFTRFQLVHLVVEGLAGALLVAGGC